MGWLFNYKHNTPKTYAEIKAKVISLHTACEGADVRFDVLQAAQVGVFWVCAVKITPLTAERAEMMKNGTTYITDADGSYTYASIIKTAWHEGGWGYKDMSEASGVYGDFSKCPASLIAKLSPLKEYSGTGYNYVEFASQWRAEILESKKKPKLKEGMRIRLKAPALFSVNRALSVYCTDFTVTTYRHKGQNRRAYIAHDIGGQLVRLTAGMVAGYEVAA